MQLLRTALPRALYLACFIGLGMVAVIALNQIIEPSMGAVLVRSVFVSALCAAPGLVHRRLWPLALVLLPIGCYLFVRSFMPVPSLVQGVIQQFNYYAARLNLGVAAYKEALIPLELTGLPELQLLMAFAAYWLTGVAAFVALSLRSPTPAAVLILTLLGYSLTLDSEAQDLTSAALFMVLATCLFVLSRNVKRDYCRLRDLVAGGSLGAIASFLAFALLAAAPSLAATPSRDWRTWDPFDNSRPVYAFNWFQNYPLLLDPVRDEPLMTVESPLPSYWKANCLDSFTGMAWLASQPFLVPLKADPQQVSSNAGPSTSYVYEIPATEPTPRGQTVTETFNIFSAYTNYFFTGGDPRLLTMDIEVPLRMNDMRSLRVNTALQPPLHYSLVALVPRITPSELVGLGAEYPEDAEPYLALPFPRLAQLDGVDKANAWQSEMPARSPDGWEWTDLYALNRRIVGYAKDPYEITLSIEQYLRKFYTYSLSPSASRYSSPYSAFLFDSRTGYCQHFAGAMALLLRYNGIPSRVALGFTCGEVSEGDADERGTGNGATHNGDAGVRTYTVSTNDAHAWVEVYFPSIGWVAFDPTPGRSLPLAGASSASPTFVDPFVSTSLSDAASSTSGSILHGPPGSAESMADSPGVTQPVDTAGPGAAAWAAAPAALVLLLLTWPLARTLWRRRRLYHGPLEQRLQASLQLLRTELRDHHVPVNPSHTLEEIAGVVHDHLGIDIDPAFICRLDAVLFGGRGARSADVRQVENLRRQVKTRLRDQRGRLKAAAAWYRPSRLRRGI